ncbi:MAG: response regulator transcription factor [Flavobacteriales bacterium]|nr:MAG: DNA-binding response regulator [Flavobacteriales bacterium TMED96]RZP12216.1 MAG: response regulator transcription factor [Flavobacteriales bacterium]|tara:strand:- start:3465 stop:4151 length:687 start_codon:yes stop_codon:yes gene_type:complete
MKKNKIKILIVDDEPDIIEILQFNLENEGYKVFSAVNGKEALSLADQHIPHLIILDLMMPVMDGIEACERLRMDKKFNNTLIMFLSARGEDYSQVAAFESGADDYVTKPIKPRILNSKVKALLRRFKNDFGQILAFENIVIDSEKYTVEVDNKQYNLPRKEFELLFLLASKPGKVFKREKIMESVWGTDVIVGDRTIDVHIRKLREKIGENFFKTIKGVGYQFVIMNK